MKKTELYYKDVGRALKVQRKRGFASLNFVPYLERGFLQDYTVQGRAHRLWLVGMSLLFLVLVGGVDCIAPSGPEALQTIRLPVQLLVILPSLLLALLATTIERWSAYSQSAVLLAFAAMVVCILGMRNVAKGSNFDVPLEYVTVAIAGICFLGRVPFWRLLPWVGGMATVTVLNEWLFMSSGPQGWYRMMVSMIMVIVSLVGGYSYEHALREAWLSRRLLELLSSQDPLTGLMNRRAIQDAAKRGLRQAVREQKSIGVALLDIDCFKLYNDNYGHRAGDECLQRVADILQTQAGRPLDCCARYGGEEFVMFWFDGDPNSIHDLARSALECIRSLQIEHEFSTVCPTITASMGLVTVVPAIDTPLDQLLEIADQAMYQAKQQGRDRLMTQHLRTDFLQRPASPKTLLGSRKT